MLMVLFRKKRIILTSISKLTAVHNDIDASILEGVKDLQKFTWLQNDIPSECQVYKNILKLQIRLETALFSKFEHLKFIVLKTFFYDIWFGFLVLWHINLCRLFNTKAILLEEQ